MIRAFGNDMEMAMRAMRIARRMGFGSYVTNKHDAVHGFAWKVVVE